MNFASKSLLISALLVAAVSSQAKDSSSDRPTSLYYGTGSNPNSHRVEGHVRRDGTYVGPHMQTNPNGRFEDNYSTKPNVNPYTGTTGTRVTPPDPYGTKPR